MRETALSELLRLPAGPVDLAATPTSSTPGAPGSKQETKERLEAIGSELADLQEQLWAAAAADGSRRRVLVVLQGMDASGKGGAVEDGLGALNARWVRVVSFGRPTEEELAHHFLWRIRRQLPQEGAIGVFDRSHYEDVVAVRVRGLAPEEVWRPRFEEINAFERDLAGDDVTLVKVFLHISSEYQRERQLRRLDRIDKRWKFSEGDLDDREHWDDYMAAYAEALERCNTAWAPWHVVPADNGWYRKWAVGQLVLETLRSLGLEWPKRPDLDIEALRARLLAG
jgi:PPK2 family polyphosphate:nucleotide phosphotransferase